MVGFPAALLLAALGLASASPLPPAEAAARAARAATAANATLSPTAESSSCAEAIAGGSELQRRSREPADKTAVHALLCSADCAVSAAVAYGPRALELLCAGPGAVTNPGGGIWGLAAPKAQQTSELGIAAGPDGTVGCFGGISAIGLTVATAELYLGSVENTCRPVTSVPLPTNHPMPASTADGRIFLAGGGLFPLGDPDRDTLFEFDAGGGWVERAAMPTSRSAGAAAEVDGSIYVAGGWPPHGSDFAVYTVAEDRWEELPPMPSQRNHLVVAPIEGGRKILAAGGRTTQGLTGTRVVEVFDIATRSWSSRSPMPESEHSEAGAYSGHNGIVAQGCLHTFGGEHSGGVFPEHFAYDPYADEWTRLADLPVPVHGTQAEPSPLQLEFRSNIENVKPSLSKKLNHAIQSTRCFYRWCWQVWSGCTWMPRAGST